MMGRFLHRVQTGKIRWHLETQEIQTFVVGGRARGPRLARGVQRGRIDAHGGIRSVRGAGVVHARLLHGVLDGRGGWEGGEHGKEINGTVFRRGAFGKCLLALKVGVHGAVSRRIGLVESNLVPQQVQVLFESVPVDVGLQLQGTQSFQDIMCQGAAVGGILEQAAGPASIANDDVVQFLQAIDQLLLLLLQHLDVSTGTISSGRRPTRTPWWRTLWDKPCHVTFCVRRTRRWHYRSGNDCTGWSHRTTRRSAVGAFPCTLPHALDFFSRHRSHALHTRFRALLSLSDGGLVACEVIVRLEHQHEDRGGSLVGRKSIGGEDGAGETGRMGRRRRNGRMQSFQLLISSSSGTCTSGQSEGYIGRGIYGDRLFLTNVHNGRPHVQRAADAVPDSLQREQRESSTRLAFEMLMQIPVAATNYPITTLPPTRYHHHFPCHSAFSPLPSRPDGG